MSEKVTLSETLTFKAMDHFLGFESNLQMVFTKKSWSMTSVKGIHAVITQLMDINMICNDPVISQIGLT